MKATTAAWLHCYVHVPFCRSLCAYCALYSEVYGKAGAAAYLRAVDAELALLRNGASRPRPRTLYIGGGTPTALNAAELRTLLRCLARRLDLSGVEEWTVESNPATTTDDRLAVLREGGVTRISLGAQAFDDSALAAMRRPHGAEDVRAALERVRAFGFENVGLDLIAGLPGVDRRAWRAALRETVALELEHVSVYALTIEEGTPLDAAIRAGERAAPGDEALLAALDEAESVLLAAGYELYELSNYARPGRRCLYNTAVWQGEDYLGIGPAASSRDGLARRTNAPDVAAYAAALERGMPPHRDEEIVTAETDAAERRVFALRLAEGLGDADVATLPETVRAHWAAELPALRRRGFLKHLGGRWQLTRRGRQVADSVLRELLP